MRFVPIAVLLLISTSAWSDAQVPKASAVPTPAQLKQYKSLLTKGRGLLDKGDYVAASASFEEALKVYEDASALTELGWARFKQNDLTRAEVATRRAIALNATPAMPGAAYYNLGRICEAKQDKACAIGAYTNSLRQRRDEAVRKRLATLDPAAADAFGPLAPGAMLGPYVSLDAFCAEAKAGCPASGEPKGECDGKLKPTLAAPAPFLSVGVLVTACGGSDDQGSENWHQRVQLALRTTAGWFLADAGFEVATGRIVEGSWKSTGLRLHTLPSGPVVEFRWHSAGGWRANTWINEGVLLAGLGPSGTPSALAMKLIDRQDPSDASMEAPLALQLSLLPSGDLSVTGKGVKKADQAALLGKHPLRFR